MEISVFIGMLQGADNPDALFTLLVRAYGGMGFEYVMYSALGNHPLHEAGGTGAVMHNFPEGWMRQYQTKGYLHVDPVRLHCQRSLSAFSWAGMRRQTKLTAIQRKVMDEAARAGLQGGFSVPLHGPFGEGMAISAASSRKDANPEPLLSAAGALAVAFHDAYTALRMPDPMARPATALTPRELEILALAAAGRNNAAIAEALSISEHGVDFHFRNILAKMDVDSRVAAVVRGLHLRLINP